MMKEYTQDVIRTSFPTRERGLKLSYSQSEKLVHWVVPHAGTWIEIPQRSTKNGRAPVVPHAGTWIEIKDTAIKQNSADVVPHAGTWIEIAVISKLDGINSGVVPHAGTWIEIVVRSVDEYSKRSFPTRERGLKSQPKQ